MNIVNRRRYIGSDNSYIQDGLIAWFDGQYNRRKGIHSSTQTYWENLADSSKRILGIDEHFTWGEDHLLIPGIQAIGTLPDIRPKTLEAVIAFSGIGAYPLLCFYNEMPKLWIGIRANNTLNFAEGGWFAPIDRNKVVSFSMVGTDPKYPNHIFVNCLEKMVKEGGMTIGTTQPFSFNASLAYGSGGGRLYCLRMYDRELLPKEIEHNYIIDKQRFNL